MDLWGPEKNAVGGMPCSLRFFDNHLANRKSASVTKEIVNQKIA